MIVSGLIVAIVIWLLMQGQSHTTLPGKPSAYESFNFNLQSADGKVTMDDFENKWVYLYVGYTFCPDICPTNLASLSNAYRQLSEEEKQHIQIILVSVDPDRDTPEHLKKYSGYFDMDMIGLTGNREEIDAVVNALGAAYIINKDEGKHYSVDHSAFTYVISPAKKLVETLPHETTPEEFLTSFKSALQQNVNQDLNQTLN